MSNAGTTDSATPSEDLAVPSVEDEPESRPGGIPLYVWVIAAVVLAIPLGLLWGEGATGAIRKNRCLGAGFLFSHTPADNRRFPTLPSQGERPCPSA
ncbi:MAG: hypothetical protein ACXVCF_12060, partial [Isosphaeraceae bacterium]